MVKSSVRAAIAQLVERIHGKDEVSGSTPDRGSILHLMQKHISDRIVKCLTYHADLAQW